MKQNISWLIKLLLLLAFLVTMFRTGRAVQKYKIAATNKTQNTLKEPFNSTPIEGEIIGVKENALAIFSPKTQSLKTLPVSIAENNTIRLSPDKLKVLVSNGLAASSENPLKIDVYDIPSNTKKTLTPIIPDGFVYGKVSVGTGFGDEYIAWEGKSQGVVYQIHSESNPTNLEYHFLSLDNKDSLIFSTEIPEDTEEILLGYLRETNNIYVADIKLPGTSVILIRLNQDANSRKALGNFDTGVLPLWRSFSPEAKYFLGIFSSQKSGGTAVDLIDMRNEEEIFPDLFDDANGLFGMWFIDSENAGAFIYKIQDQTDFVISKIYTGNIASKQVETITISQAVQKQILNEKFIDLSLTGTIVTSKHATNGTQTVTLPEGFTPIGFIRI